MAKLWRRISNLDRLSNFMNIAFGCAFLMVSLYFQFGKTVITTPEAIIEFDVGYITEERLWVRIMEMGISLALITLGIVQEVRRRNNKKWEIPKAMPAGSFIKEN